MNLVQTELESLLEFAGTCTRRVRSFAALPASVHN